MTLLAGFGGEERFIDTRLSRHEPRRRDALAFAMQYRVLLLSGPDGSGIAIALGPLPFEEEAARRSRYLTCAEGIRLRI